jgi:hypothetical protein
MLGLVFERRFIKINIMGLFLSMSGIVGAEKGAVEAALRSYTEQRKGRFQKSVRTTKDPNTLALLEDKSRCSVLYPWGFFNWDEASCHLSADLGVPVFSFHIHDGDLWMFTLFNKGEQVAQFNPLPEYWDDGISDEERAAWSGDASAIAACIPDLDVDLIRPYFRHWDLNDGNPGKAFPDDRFNFHDCWQMCDFMQKVRIKYPLSDTGQMLGETYEFIVPKE